MELIGSEFVQFLVLQIPNFAGFVILSGVLLHINGRLLALLEAELDDCRENREREQMLHLKPPRGRQASEESYEES